MEADGSNPVQLTNNPADDRYPGYSPDKSRIVFISDRDGDFEIYSMSPDGSNVVQLTSNTVLDTGPAWSPDGSEIAFATERDGNREIYVMKADGSNARRLTFDPAEDTGPAFAPDGSKLAFTAMRDGNGEIYVMNRDGSGPTRVTNAPTLEQSPDWQPVSASTPGGTAAPASDRRAPRLRVRLKRRQHLRKRAVVLSVECDEACAASASGRVKARRLKKATQSLAAGVPRRFSLAISRRTARVVRRALHHRRSVGVLIRITARDETGNAQSAARRVRLVR
jgi:dipeptidyl aminopeptidase/acylaminoacyl peptidase